MSTSVNPFKVARSKFKTIGEVIDALTEAFSEEGSADIMGAYMLEMAAKAAEARRPERQVEWDEVMARIDESKKKADAEAALMKAHSLETHFRQHGTPHHSAGSQQWEIGCAGNLISMDIWPKSNIPRYRCNGAELTTAQAWELLFSK